MYFTVVLLLCFQGGRASQCWHLCADPTCNKGTWLTTSIIVRSHNKPPKNVFTFAMTAGADGSVMSTTGGDHMMIKKAYFALRVTVGKKTVNTAVMAMHLLV